MRLESIPSIAAEIYLDPREYIDLPGIILGRVGEVDLASLHATDPALAEELEQYYLSAMDLWYRNTQDTETIKIKHLLVQSHQRDTKEGKTLLRQELSDLLTCPATKAVGDLLHRKPGSMRVPADAGYTLTKEKDLYTAVFTGQRQTWPKTLGGPQRPGEIARHVHVSFSYAKWRDSKVKKLTQVSVEVVEVWPKPTRTLCKTGL